MFDCTTIGISTHGSCISTSTITTTSTTTCHLYFKTDMSHPPRRRESRTLPGRSTIPYHHVSNDDYPTTTVSICGCRMEAVIASLEALWNDGYTDRQKMASPSTSGMISNQMAVANSSSHERSRCLCIAYSSSSSACSSGRMSDLSSFLHMNTALTTYRVDECARYAARPRQRRRHLRHRHSSTDISKIHIVEGWSPSIFSHDALITTRP